MTNMSTKLNTRFISEIRKSSVYPGLAFYNNNVLGYAKSRHKNGFLMQNNLKKFNYVFLSNEKYLGYEELNSKQLGMREVDWQFINSSADAFKDQLIDYNSVVLNKGLAYTLQTIFSSFKNLNSKKYLGLVDYFFKVDLDFKKL